TYLRIKVLSSNKQLSPHMGPLTGKNFVEMYFNQQSNSINYAQLQGNSEFRVGKDIQATFNGTGNYYLEEGKYNFYDTWLALKRKASRIKLGNIYGNDYDYTVSGRGAKVNTGIGVNKEIEVLALESNYNLFGNYFPEQKSSKIAGAKYKFGGADRFSGKVSYLFDHDPRLNSDTQLAHATSAFTLDSLHKFEVEAGLSHEKGLVTKDEHFGASIGLNYEATLGKWDFHSLNSWASRNYAGLNRGAFDFNQNIGYRISDKQRIFGRYQNTQVHPGHLALQNTD